MHPLIILIIIFINYAQSVTIIPLKDYSWRVRDSDNTIDIPAKIPSGIYTDLQLANIIGNPLFRFNDKESLWVAEKTWIYEVTFSVSDEIASDPNTELIFHGLDGTAEIILNDKKIGTAVNTFVRYRFHVTRMLKDGENKLQIIFPSPIELASKLSQEFPDNFSNRETNTRIIKHGHFLRKMAASFGCDWGPTFPSVGIWKEIELVKYEYDLIIRDILTSSIYLNKKEWMLNITVICEKQLKVQFDILVLIEAILQAEHNKLIRATQNINITESDGNVLTINLRMNVPKNDVTLWWPNGYGKQNLYKLTINVFTYTKVNTRSIKIGFRTVQLNQDFFTSPSVSNRGRQFKFIVNDTPIFIKGANFLPSDILLENTSNIEKIEDLILSAKMAHMNMLRVSAIGIYQSDYFYELCDTHGILVWEDMMFYKEKYPFDNVPFLSSVSVEIEQQIMRLQYHPSIVLWVGNCEIELTLYDEQKNNLHDLRINEYLKYTKKFEDIVLKYDNNRPYLISTPSNGLQSEHDTYERIITNPNDNLNGDVHRHFNKNNWIMDDETVPRFLTEFGIPSFPSLHSFLEIANVEDIDSIFSPLIEHRQSGNNTKNTMIEIICSISYHIGQPVSLHDVNNIIYASQINQAWAMKLKIETYRQFKLFVRDREGIGLTMGTLYWHLNDVWQAPTSSSIEFNGKWKMLHYYAQKFFAPVISNIVLDATKNKQIILISDLLSDETVKVKFEIFKWNSLRPVFSHIYDSIILRSSSLTPVSVKNIPDKVHKKHCKLPFTNKDWKCLVKISLIHTNDEVIHDNYLLPKNVIFHEIIHSNPDIHMFVTDCESNKKCSILIQTDIIALFVWLDAGNIRGYFSDNGFIMTQSKIEITFYATENIDADQLSHKLTLKVVDKKYLSHFIKPTKKFKTETCKNY